MSNQTLYDVPSRMFPRGKAGVLRYHTVTYSRLLVLEYLRIPKVSGCLGAKPLRFGPGSANLGAKASGYFWNAQVHRC